MLDSAAERIQHLLPTGWRVTRISQPDRRDAVLELRGPGDAVGRFAVEAKRSGSMPSALVVASMRELQRSSDLSPLWVSDYIGAALRERLTAEQLSYADATGWVRLTSADPLIMLTSEGPSRSPRPQRDAAITRMNGRAAGRIIRALSDLVVPTRVRELAAQADASPGSVSKLLATLAAEEIVQRDDGGRVVGVRRRALIRRWVSDYSFTKSNGAAVYYLAPRGIERAVADLSGQSGIAVTGSLAARSLLPDSVTSVVPLRLLAVYADEPGALADRLGLIETDQATANVVIATPQTPEILSDVEGGRLPLAPTPLILADLLTLPGRGDAEAEQLMSALGENDQLWRR